MRSCRYGHAHMASSQARHSEERGWAAAARGERVRRAGGGNEADRRRDQPKGGREGKWRRKGIFSPFLLRSPEANDPQNQKTAQQVMVLLASRGILVRPRGCAALSAECAAPAARGMVQTTLTYCSCGCLRSPRVVPHTRVASINICRCSEFIK